ncbi:uncharacterized protein LOC126739197 [Anthonomus grandis grandis]|uniref:uncharacterized protein LOC126739197 n=1 Tax=Anthonomus grandis grandis TaxID=2921223 RepID=UPI002166BCE8|nr:uncharacterized protein LOC126739197 [Anthonomus grandis grandis]
MAYRTIILAVFIELSWAQETTSEAPICYGAGSMAAAVILTFIFTLLVAGGFFFIWRKRENLKKDNHLILETDPERGAKAEYAFDNPGFKDATLTATSEKMPKQESASKIKWGHWSPLAALKLKPEKKKALDDSNLQNHEVKVVALKSQDFTGLGFNICGNMKEGIYIRDILHRGPAYESGKLNPGDRINSVTISFEHMVYEDALNILSYASPYEVMIEAKGGRILASSQGQGHTPIHPIYRSTSAMDLTQPEKTSKKKLFGDDHSSSSNYSSLQKSRSNMTTLERKESKSPRPNQGRPKKAEKSPQKMTPEMFKAHLEQSIDQEHLKTRLEVETHQKSENVVGHKFGTKVLPMDSQQKSPKILEQNQNNMNIERHSIDEVDLKVIPPQAKKREKKSPEPDFERTGSGIRRDVNGIPLEIPDHMNDAALMARRNRKSSVENGLANDEDLSKKSKGKAPSPPSELKINFSLGPGSKSRAFEDLSNLEHNDSLPIQTYDSDSEDGTNNMSSVNTIELNSSDITIHQIQEEERKSRKTASTGDLTNMKKAPKSNSGTLERAQSLDITDTSGSGLSKKRTYDARENLLIDREPRLSLILDGLTTFQRNRLKSSAEWESLEDAILNLNRDDEELELRRKSEPHFNAVMDKVVQIKRESAELEVLSDEIAKQYQKNAMEEPNKAKIVNKIWPDESELNGGTFENSGWKRLGPEITKRSLEVDEDFKGSPAIPERNKLKINEEVREDQEVSTKSTFSISNKPSTNISVEFECIKPVPPKREKTPEKEAIININDRIPKISPATPFEKMAISQTCSLLSKNRNQDGPMIKDEWEIETLNNTSPPPSMTLVDEVMDSYNKNFAGNTVTVVQTTDNLPDETKSIENQKSATANFIFVERAARDNDINVPDDVKVSRGSYESLECKKSEEIPKSDDAKKEDRLVSHVTVTENGGSSLHSLELSINNEPNELYTTALENNTSELGGEALNDVTVIISQPNKVNVEVSSAEQIVEICENSFSKLTKNPEEILLNEALIAGETLNEVEITQNKYSTFEADQKNTFHIEEPLVTNIENEQFKGIEDESPAISLELEAPNSLSDHEKKSYITEIQVLTPNKSDNESDIAIKVEKNEDQLEDAFEKYVKNFERRMETFESNIQNFENNLEEFIRDEPKSIVLEENSDIEKQASKIQEIVEEQLKTLPEMRFTTSSYESSGRKTPEKRHSFELLRSNFEKASNDKSPPRRESFTPPKSRIPISMTMKTPPMSPERRDSRNLENEDEKAILELMASPLRSPSPNMHSTPFTSKIKPPSISSKNVSVTSIRNNSKIPSGLPTLSSRPPIPPRKSEEGPQTPTNGTETSFKQWVFNPSNNVTNVTVGKDK